MLDLEQQSCKSKCRYPEPPTIEERQGWLRSYYCRLCDGYHLTSRGAKRVTKIDNPPQPMVLRGGYWVEK